MKRLSWKYVAGLFDGEGCVSVGFRIKRGLGEYPGKVGGGPCVSIYPQVSIQLTLTESCKFVLEHLQNNYGGTLYFAEPRKSKVNHKPTWCWRLQERTKCRALFQNIAHHCLIKNEQMRFAIWTYDNMRGKVTAGVADTMKREFKQLKADPQRLSERAIAALKVAIDATVHAEGAPRLA